MICEGKVNIDGLNFEKIDGKKILKSIFILDIENNKCIEVPILDDIDKEKLAKELLDCYRKEVVACIDIKNDHNRPNTNYVIVKFIEIKNK
jgi:hypothetical protein